MAAPVTPAVETAASTDTAIEIANLTVRYRRNAVALSGVNLAVPDGQIVALIGTNGAGKSTLLRCMVRLIEPAGGVVTICGTRVTGASRRALREVRRDVGFVFQRFHLIPRLSAFHNVVHGAMGRYGMRCAWPLTAPESMREWAMESLDRVGLAAVADRRVDTLSGGQQQRVAIARMLMQQPRVILADEPVASLDPASATAVMDLMCEIAAERGVTVVAALHQVDLALRYADRVVGLRDGRVDFDRAARECDAAQLGSIYAQAVS
ncbi:phosphonate ABC transporter ATPase [Mycolicibacterium phlei]|uniref:Phosphonate ABC transporter ATPase n=1 Tax=Mycolicibacterium phlei DSM 43239 = CCUG 21000 TaxID=1226750 RepID=A0A5N5V1J6_MYCPH|nr:phosphonate ABC transporter ATP-binding protein [Mycolicibacterium phlei]VEG09185.1 phosphonate ABC transporter ATPase [Mycobacteroides chelonae]AMO61069.1 Phosphate-import ATP-binding protein PhnC [Mycolicibacterium phlei]EID08964.1 phosphonate ABC transporter ATPase [Mycolicibacterium phlei RIVM601174]KAB7754987.1 phosphonate ABC transporter ATPase [Mycolicibacterium phlei DSM 43239 = CCUG 21000]KXW64043.1 phosphonate ABC transporter ATPase [Mycolicibacterium phlei DSM 43239 = CCUG 21000]